MTTPDLWDLRYRKALVPPGPCWLLEQFAHLLPEGGLALDLACGLGGNALFLARRGFEVEAWDLSGVAIEKLRAWAVGLPIHARQLDLLGPWPRIGFDLIVVSHFLERRLFSRIERALRPGGLLYYQTFVRSKIHNRGPRRPEFLLAENELLAAFPSLIVRFYREDGRTGDLERGLRDEAYLIGEKR